MERVSGTQGYAEQAETLAAQYEALRFAEVHAAVLPLLPPAPARVCDVGAGSGRDAGALAALGHAVLAVEPSAALRARAMALHPSPRIAWLDDSLPLLARVPGRFALVLLSAVFMHLDPAERALAMPRLAALLAPGGLLVVTLRRGPIPAGRRMFAVGAEEVIAPGLRLVLRQDHQPSLQPQPGVTWTRLAFRR